MVENSGVTRTLLLILAVGCSQEPTKRPVTPPTESGSLGAGIPASLVTADTTTVLLPLTLPSQLYVEHDATIYARSAGIVESVLVDLGRQVVTGQPLARLESADQRIALDQAQDKFANTRAMVERQRALKVAGVVTQADSERVEFEHREAVLELKKAQRDYDLTKIVAPFSGVVTGRSARIGRLVSSGDSLFRITALKPVLATVHVPEPSAPGITVGAEAEVEGPGTTARARVIRASPIIDAASGTREIVLQLITGGPRLTPGTSVMVKVGSQPRRVVAIPRGAVAQDGYALVWADDRTTLRALTLGSELEGGRVEVLTGLAPGEKVVRAAP